jgi:hypothetical protein
MRRCRHCFLRLSSGWCPADTGDSQEALDAAEAEIVSAGEVAGSGSAAVGGDQVVDVALIEALAQAPWTLCARFQGAHWAGERHGGAKSQISGLRGVRVSGKYLHQRF